VTSFAVFPLSSPVVFTAAGTELCAVEFLPSGPFALYPPARRHRATVYELASEFNCHRTTVSEVLK
jgi:hypothetical protein